MSDGDYEQVRQCVRCRGEVQGADSTSRSLAGDETIAKTWPRSSQAECSLRGGIGCNYPGVGKCNNTKPGSNGISVFSRRGTLISSHSKNHDAPEAHSASDGQTRSRLPAQHRQDVVRGDAQRKY
jgi:hypothetical protein